MALRGVTGNDRRSLNDDYRLSVLWQIATQVWQAAATAVATKESSATRTYTGTSGSYA